MKNLYMNNYSENLNPTYNSDVLNNNLYTLKKNYPFIEVNSIGKSVLGKDILCAKIGTGKKEVFYSASYHANEYITSIVLNKFLSDYCFSYKNNYKMFNYPARLLFEKTSLYIVPMVNPDGVDLVTGKFETDSPVYNFAKNISNSFPSIPFPLGWKANLRGESLINFHLYSKI